LSDSSEETGASGWPRPAFVALTGTLQAVRWDLPLGWGLTSALLIMLDFVLVALRFGPVAFMVAAFTVSALAAYGFRFSQRPSAPRP